LNSIKLGAGKRAKNLEPDACVSPVLLSLAPLIGFVGRGLAPDSTLPRRCVIVPDKYILSFCRHRSSPQPLERPLADGGPCSYCGENNISQGWKESLWSKDPRIISSVSFGVAQPVVCNRRKSRRAVVANRPRDRAAKFLRVITPRSRCTGESMDCHVATRQEFGFCWDYPKQPVDFRSYL